MLFTGIGAEDINSMTFENAIRRLHATVKQKALAWSLCSLFVHIIHVTTQDSTSKLKIMDIIIGMVTKTWRQEIQYTK